MFGGYTAPQPVVCGVYLLFENRKLTYVGRSKDVYRRLDDHRRNGRTFDYATIMAVPEADAAWVEKALIGACATAENGRKTQDPTPIKISSPRPVPERSGRRLFSVRDVCQMYNIGRSTLYVEMRAGRLQYTKVGKLTRFSAQALDTWLDGFATGA